MNDLPPTAPSAIQVGILSDSHLARLTPEFLARVEACFAGVSNILHAGDLTELSVLQAFAGRELHAVHGNMCSMDSYEMLPMKKTITVGNFRLGLIHHVGRGYDFERQLPGEFGPVDCIVYGHTHHPVCFDRDGTLFINPGSFQPSSRFGTPGTYAILTVTPDRLQATIREVPC